MFFFIDSVIFSFSRKTSKESYKEIFFSLAIKFSFFKKAGPKPRLGTLIILSKERLSDLFIKSLNRLPRS